MNQGPPVEEARNYLTRWAREVERALDELLPPQEQPPQVLHRAMRYATLGGGKRLRAVLAVAACEALGGEGRTALGFAAALEMVHAYSLVHDDLPAMDDDDFRRGKPSCHRVFGEGVAILAGDALQSLAFEVLADMPRRCGVSDATALALAGELARAMGSRGMAGGQADDLAAQNQPGGLGAAAVEAIHRRKTGALLAAAVVGGGLVAADRGPAGRELPGVQALERYGQAVGLAFQVVDDLLDQPGDAGPGGRGTGRDRPRQKATYPAVVGVERSWQTVGALTEQACAELEVLGPGGRVLRGVAQLMLHRQA